MIKNTYKGEASLIIWIFFASLMGVFVRFLNQYFQPFQQMFLRSFLGLIMSIIVFNYFLGKLNFSKINKKDISFLILRSIILSLSVFFYVLAIVNAKLGNVGFIGAIPSTAILGILFLGERLTLKKFLCLFLSFTGTLLILLKDFGSFSIGIGELYALFSAFLFSGGYLLGKKISDKMGDKEITVISTFLIAIFALCISMFFEDSLFGLYSSITPTSIIFIILASITFVCISYFGIYGFKTVDAIVASSIEFLEAVFSVILGYMIFSEIPSTLDFIGGAMIIGGAYFMIRLNIKK